SSNSSVGIGGGVRMRRSSITQGSIEDVGSDKGSPLACRLHFCSGGEAIRRRRRHDRADGTACMRVADVMSREVELASPEATVQEAATARPEYDVGAGRIGSGESIDGTLTDRDIILRAVVDGRNPAELRATDIMSTTLFTCRENDTLEDAFRIMSGRQVRRLPVVD